MAEQIDLPDFTRGDVWTNKLVFKDADGLAVDITGWRFWMTLKLDPTVTDAEAPAQVVVDASGADALAGEVFLTFAAEVTETLLTTSYSYDTQFSRWPGDNSTVAYGRVRVRQDITRDRR